MTLAAPFPYFGGKRRAAARIWQALGDPAGYVEPFAGSAAVLLARPAFTGRRVETLNDADGWLVNTWRAIQLSPADVALAVREWCAAAPRDLRVILCGYDAEHDALLARGWSVTEGKSGGGAGYSTNGCSTARARTMHSFISSLMQPWTWLIVGPPTAAQSVGRKSGIIRY
jgi:hypothetical protein